MEEIIDIGGNRFGLLTRAQGSARPECVVLFNAGLIHRSGPQRFHVDLARRLSASGYDVFRFDLPGVGDAAMDGATSPRLAAARVFDLLQSTIDARSFIVGGICSAADLGWRMAVADPRVVGLLLIDPLAVQGWWRRVGKLWMAMRSPLHEWPAKILRAFRRVQREQEEPEIVAGDYRDWPSEDEFRQQAKALLERGVRILALYTGGVAGYLLHPKQIEQTFGDMSGYDHLRVEFRPELDHVLYAAGDRRSVVDLIDGWLAPAGDGVVSHDA